MKSTKIAILGVENLGIAIAQGIVASGQALAKDIILTRRQLAKLAALKKTGFQLTSDNAAAVKNASIIILCVQPKQLSGLLNEIAGVLNPKNHILVSTITGISTEEIYNQVKKEIPIIRAMPNTAIAVGESMTCLCDRGATEKQLTQIKNLFDALGKTLIVEERLMKASTVLAASGIAFFMRYIRAATQGGIQ
ncbi:MAG: NAD(P)-binding domain-containing protein, partial [Cyclobacteriaceae bacterium]|nr:NAD(P)-binding domain-containing protein [Cyclobacteriaceae bacterium]